jgi:hypothetical protein
LFIGGFVGLGGKSIRFIEFGITGGAARQFYGLLFYTPCRKLIEITRPLSAGDAGAPLGFPASPADIRAFFR